jgi:hypothetical protein
MFGKVSQAEYDKMEAQGWEIVRQPTQAQVDKFCDPTWIGHAKTIESENDDFFVLVYVDDDLGKTLTAWHELKEWNKAGRAAAAERTEV